MKVRFLGHTPNRTKNICTEHFTIGKVYDVISLDECHFRMLDDRGINIGDRKHNFEVVKPKKKNPLKAIWVLYKRLIQNAHRMEK